MLLSHFMDQSISENIFLFHLRAYSLTIPRPFSVRYNAYTQNVEVINNKEQIINLTRTIKGKLPKLTSLF